MAVMKKLGDKTEYGKVTGIMWLGERYYFLLKDGVVSLMPASTIEARPTVRRKPPIQQAKECHASDVLSPLRRDILKGYSNYSNRQR